VVPTFIGDDEPDDAQAAAVIAATAIEKNDVGLTWGIGNRESVAERRWLLVARAGSW